MRMFSECFMDCEMIVFLRTNEVEGLEIYLSRYICDMEPQIYYFFISGLKLCFL